MDKTQAQTSIKNVYGEVFSFSPSALVALFEIDIGPIGFNRGLFTQTEISSEKSTIFRFHNNTKLTINSIFWNKKEYVAVPIVAEGFEINAKGTLPTPKLSLTVSDESIPQLSILKDKISQFGDLTGAKVTRIRTFAKFLDTENFWGSKPPDGFAPDPNAELPRDIYFIDNKEEDKNTILFNLMSLFDVEGVKLPRRLVVSNSCPFQYRGEGCLYEYSNRRNTTEHGEITDSTLPISSPPIATELDEYIQGLLGETVHLVDRGEHVKGNIYKKGEFVFIEHDNIKYYFVSKINSNTYEPPNSTYWIADACSKKIKGCNFRFGTYGSADGNVIPGNLPFGAYVGVSRFK